jgi:hypothetical protein
VDNRGKFHVFGVAVGVIVAIYAATQRDWPFAIVFAVASVVMGIGVAHRIRQSRGGD